MDFEYRKATLDDLQLLVQTRIEVLRAANHLNESVDMSKVAEESSCYYQHALEIGLHTAYLVFDGDLFIGAGGISYYTVMPTYHNPTGKKALQSKHLNCSSLMQKAVMFLQSVWKQRIWADRYMKNTASKRCCPRWNCRWNETI